AAHDQRRLGGNVRVGEIVLGLPLLGNADLVDDGVVEVGVDTGDQPVPLAFDELGLDADPLGDLAADLDIEADESAGAVVVGEGRIGALGADPELAGAGYRLQIRLR